MSREWKPGDVAMVRWGTYGEARGIYVSGRNRWVDADNAEFDGEEDGLTIRPLLVIDPEDTEAVERLCDAMYGGHGGGVTTRTQDALRSLLAPPKPPEPQGLGAVVRDQGNCMWVRTNADPYPWSFSARDEAGGRFTDSCTYADIDAVEVLSEGVQP